MKLWSKEALLLGGMYCVLNILFTYIGFEIVTDVLFGGFILCLVLLCFNKTPKFIDKTIKNYPQTAYYLASIGWMPYFVIISLVGFIASACFIKYSDDTISGWVKFFVWILDWGIPLSLVIAFVRQRLNKV